MRLTEPLAPDQPLEDAAQRKIPERAGSELFSDRRHGERRESAPSTGILPARPLSIGESDAHGPPQHIHWSYAVIEKTDGDPSGGLHVLIIKGTGVIALSVATSPLVMTVQTDYPVNVSSSSLISWSGNLIPTLVHDEALAEIMQPGPDAGVTLRLEGDGKVLMEKSAPR